MEHSKSGEVLRKSKKRVKDLGEIFTPSWVVKDMCDMLQGENKAEDAFRIDSTFLEPSCGTGNFLVEIFARKLERCKTERDGARALSSIYGIDIMQDNVDESRERLKMMFRDRFGHTPDAVNEVLERNIICGDSLEIMKKWAAEESDVQLALF